MTVRRCGHPATPENTSRHGKCVICARERARLQRASIDPADRQFDNRVNYLPTALENARRKFVKLTREARRYGMIEEANDAWNRAISEAQVEAFNQGGSIGFGDGVR